MLTKNPDNRPNPEELLRDEWVLERGRNRIEDNIISGDALTNLRNFKITMKLEQATLAFIASQLVTGEESEEIRKAFIAMDENGDGRLSLQEVKKGFEKADLAKDLDIDQILQNCDTDYNGFIDYNEFLTATLNWHKVLSQSRLDAAFNAIDVDKSGTITLEEIKQFIGRDQVVEDSVWDKIMKEADTNGDGVIDLREFKEAILKHVG